MMEVLYFGGTCLSELIVDLTDLLDKSIFARNANELHKIFSVFGTYASNSLLAG
jgi:hypothetical protein